MEHPYTIQPHRRNAQLSVRTHVVQHPGVGSCCTNLTAPCASVLSLVPGTRTPHRCSGLGSAAPSTRPNIAMHGRHARSSTMGEIVQPRTPCHAHSHRHLQGRGQQFTDAASSVPLPCPRLSCPPPPARRVQHATRLPHAGPIQTWKYSPHFDTTNRPRIV